MEQLFEPSGGVTEPSGGIEVDVRRSTIEDDVRQLIKLKAHLRDGAARLARSSQNHVHGTPPAHAEMRLLGEAQEP
jgi:hypothetical protein